VENHRDELPNLGHSGNRAINEILYQIEENPKWSTAERAWLGALLHCMVDQFMSYEEAMQAMKMDELRNGQFEGDMIGKWIDADEYEDD
jgi:hypothetical protein